MSKITVIGGGAWGSALAQMAATSNHEVCLYARDAAVIAEINTVHTNKRYLGDIVLSDKIMATRYADQALEQAELILVVIPAQALRHVLQSVQKFIPPHCVLILCAKGIEQGSRMFMSEVVEEVLPNQAFAILSGPSFATDVARGRPTAVTIASQSSQLTHHLVHILSGQNFRCYGSTDVIGVEAGGALKNVLALAAGVATGCGLGLSAQAALVTRGFAELRRIAIALGGKAETMTGLSVLGDLMLTCSSNQSRNYAYGLALGQNQSIEGMPLAEGVTTAPVAADLCEHLGIEAPIIHTVSALLAKCMKIDDAIEHLITRPLKFED